ncbi:MAG: ElyC/SanA/YdcF family protein [Pseudomonadota bacterium]
MARAKELGVPAENIAIEEEARNIGENIGLTRKIFPQAQRIIWVTKPQTQRRVRASLDARALDIVSTVTAPDHSFDAQPTDSHSMHDLLCELVGDTWRVAAYPDLGFMVEQEIPEQVREAFNLLVSEGFTAHLPRNVLTLEDR